MVICCIANEYDLGTDGKDLSSYSMAIIGGVSWYVNMHIGYHSDRILSGMESPIRFLLAPNCTLEHGIHRNREHIGWKPGLDMRPN